MTAHTPPHEERLNLRPVVLGICFFWGLVCGFLVNALRDPAVLQDKPATDKSPTNEAPTDTELSDRAREQREKLGAAEKQEAPDESGPAGDEPRPAMKDKPESLTATHPSLPPLALKTGWGLSGQTAEHPSVPLRVRRGPAAPVPSRDRRVESLEPPELGPPE